MSLGILITTYTEMKQHMQHHDMRAEFQLPEGVTSVQLRSQQNLCGEFLYRVTVCWKCSCFDCRVSWNRKLHKRRRRLLHSALSLAAQCIVIGPVCVFTCLQWAGIVCLWVCYHDNSKLHTSILTKLGL